MFRREVRSVQNFLLGDHFSNGLRITLGIFVACLLLKQLDMLQYGVEVSLGVMTVGIVDLPGPISHRRNAMLVSAGLVTLMAILMGLVNENVYLTGLTVTASCLLFSMFLLYGNRASRIGTTVLLVMILSIDTVLSWQDAFFYSALMLAGGIWYVLLSYGFYRLSPYRLGRQTLSDSILLVADFLRVKSKFYGPGIQHDKAYKRLLDLQSKVHQKQDEVREVLFKTRRIVSESTPESRFLLLTFVDMVDLFEQAMSMNYDYEKLHDEFGSNGILTRYTKIINEIANALGEVAFALKRGGAPELPRGLEEEIALLKEDLAMLDGREKTFNAAGLAALKNIGVNIQNMVERIATINAYFNKKKHKGLELQSIDVTKFITSQNFDKKLFWENLSFKSDVFRHSLRVTIAMLVGFMLSRFLDFSHSYWILLTILVILKPGFSVTRVLNYQRLTGTVMGAALGMVFIVWVKDAYLLFVILLVLMLLCYSFLRKNYILGVMFMTSYILILFQLLGMGGLQLAKERVYDTLIGSAIALVTSYALFPDWEYKKAKKMMVESLLSNKAYFEQVVMSFFDPVKHNLTTYKVARKDMYVNASNLSSLFQRMLSDPKSKQMHIKEIHQFTVLSHILSSYISSLSQYYWHHEVDPPVLRSLKPLADNTISLLEQAAEDLNGHKKEASEKSLISRELEGGGDTQESQIIFIEKFESTQKVAYDIWKLAQKLSL